MAGEGEGAGSGDRKDCRYKATGQESPPDPGSTSDSSDGCSVVEVRGGGEVSSLTTNGGGGSGGGRDGGGRKASTTRTSTAAGARNESPQLGAETTGPERSVGLDSGRLTKRPRLTDARCGQGGDDRGGGCNSDYSDCSGGDSRWGGPRPSATTATKKARSLSFADDDDDDDDGNGDSGGRGSGGDGGSGGSGSSDRGGGGGSGGGGGGSGPKVLQCDLSDNSPSPLLPRSSTSVSGSTATSMGRQASLDGVASNPIPRAGGIAAVANAAAADPCRLPGGGARTNALRDSGGRPVFGAPRGSRTAVAVHNIGDDIRSSGSLPAPSGAGGAAVVDLSLDSPSPPPPPRSRTHAAAAAALLPLQTGVGGGSRRSGGGGGAVDPCSSDDEFAM
ncbi:unnamed protein product [Laminaria digitata]